MRIMRKDIVYPDLSFIINGILYKVRREQGLYCNEQQYCDSIEAELKAQKIHYAREKIVDPRNKIDFLVEDKIVLEIKAKQFITKEDYYQARRYLNVLRLKLAILVNMRRYYINPKRILNSAV